MTGPTDTRTHLVCEPTQTESVIALLHREQVQFVEAGWSSYWAADLRTAQRRTDMEVVARSDPGGIPNDYMKAIATGVPYVNGKWRRQNRGAP
jgi:hypothetical protein